MTPSLHSLSVTYLEAELLTHLSLIANAFERPALASSMSAEDMVLIHAVARTVPRIDVFVLDTGRLHEETLQLVAKVRELFGIDIEAIRPDRDEVAEYVEANGANAFYESVDLRHRCCEIRKVRPLARALEGRDAWITGQRRAHGPARAELAVAEQDAERGIAKFNPLALWSDDDLADYVKRHEVPINPLHARGYSSIGCEPCTRAIRPGEDPRAGRWWWESSSSKECGLHVVRGPSALISEAKVEHVGRA